MNKELTYEISSHFIEQKRITITNQSKTRRLCKVMVNHKLFKILLLAPNEKETLVYEKPEGIEIIEMTDLTESEENKMTSMVVAKNIVKTFGRKRALNSINFEIREGEIFGFLGPSGSGKTTMINILLGNYYQTVELLNC